MAESLAEGEAQSSLWDQTEELTERDRHPDIGSSFLASIPPRSQAEAHGGPSTSGGQESQESDEEFESAAEESDKSNTRSYLDMIADSVSRHAVSVSINVTPGINSNSTSKGSSRSSAATNIQGGQV